MLLGGGEAFTMTATYSFPIVNEKIVESENETAKKIVAVKLLFFFL